MTECLANIVPENHPGRFIGLSCGKPATVTVEYGCVHEHVRTEDFCPRHAGKITSRDATQACTECWVTGHACQVIGRIVQPAPP